MIKLFKKNKQKSKKHSYFLGYDEDHDPWESSTIHFFSEKKQRKNKEEFSKSSPHLKKQPKNYFWDQPLEEISFPKLNASYNKIEEKHNYNDLYPSYFPQEPSILEKEASHETNIKIDPNQRLFDIYPQKIHKEKFEYFSKKKDLPFDFQSSINLNNSTSLSHSNSISSKHEDKSEQSNPTQKTLHEDTINAKIFQSNNPYTLLKIGLTGCILLFLALILWVISQQNKASLPHEDNLIVISSPKTIKIRPEEPDKPLIPYQDELIYGEIDSKNKINETGERLLPPVDFAPDITIENNIPPEEEYLDDIPLKKRPNTIKEKKKTEQILEEKEKRFLNSQNFLPQKVKQKTLQSIKKEEHKSQPVQEKPVKPLAKTIYIQLGTLPSIEIAKKEASRLLIKYKVLAKHKIIIRPFKTLDGRTVYRLLVGPFSSKAQTQEITQTLGTHFKIIH